MTVARKILKNLTLDFPHISITSIEEGIKKVEVGAPDREKDTQCLLQFFIFWEKRKGLSTIF